MNIYVRYKVLMQILFMCVIILPVTHLLLFIPIYPAYPSDILLCVMELLEAGVRPGEREACFQATPLIPVLPARRRLTIRLSTDFADVLAQ